MANGIDEDGNGYVDDFHGWNFAPNTQSTPPQPPYDVNDDTPFPGHGTHVSGIIGAVGFNSVGVTGVN